MSNRERLILEMLSRADSRLQAQQDLALAADARAMQFAGILIAGAAVTMAIGGDGLSPSKWAISVPLVLSAVCAIYSARPVSNWFAPGMEPSDFDEDLAKDREFEEVFMELAGHLDICIKSNRSVLAANAIAMRLATYLAIAAPVLGALASIAT